jgi:REP element-mobilizing transposase RayT
MQAHLHAIGGISDHIHLLIRLPATLSIAEADFPFQRGISIPK